MLTLIAAVILAGSDSTSVSIWQAGREIQELTFRAQTELFAADRTGDVPGHAAAATALVDRAAAVYAERLRPRLGQISTAAASAVAAVLSDARAAAAAANGPALAAARGRIWTALLAGSALGALERLAAGDVRAAREWLRVREYRESTRANAVEDRAAKAIIALEAGTMDTASAVAAVEADLRDTYFYRLRGALAEVDASAVKRYDVRAAEWAGLARGYYAILRDDFASKQGADTGRELAGAFAALEAAAVASRWDRLRERMESVRAGIDAYQPVELSPEEVERRSRLLHLFVDLVYIEYRDGVRDGDIIIPIEYHEAITFRDQAEAVFQEIQADYAARDPAGAAELRRSLERLDAVIARRGDVSRVKGLVDNALARLERDFGVDPTAGQGTAAFEVIDQLLGDLVIATRQGRYEDAERSRIEAYAIFESGPEQHLAHRAPLLSRTLEGLFWEGSGGRRGLAVLLRERAAVGSTEGTVGELRGGLAEARALLSEELTAPLAALSSAAIILREGLEAVLIIGAILGYMRATAAPRRYSAWVYAGIASAVGLSLATWWAANRLIPVSAANRELIEGITSLLAVAVLFYVTNWLFHKVYVLDWVRYVKSQVGRAVTRGSALTLAGLGFTVVYREGFETVLFYQALLFDAPPGPVLTGFVAGSVLILGIAYAMLRLSKRLPVKPFFTATTALLLVLALSFTGSGIRELQEAGLIPATLLSAVPESLVLMEALGIFPTVETTVAQALFVVAVVVTFAGSVWQGRRKAAVQAQVGA